MEGGIWGNITQHSGARNSQISSRIKYLSFPLRYDCSWQLAPRGYFSKGILPLSLISHNLWFLFKSPTTTGVLG